ncbi:MAG: two-component system response regulator [Desulfuromonadales bacterium GWD2_61_12]|nr:MAG: two-component system response regulator [Desulfuromonadales bacterium GWC2_61_20]OGR35535.1 MAG: two-component system response regulator [Desulfuromonadales bacterium GWD2_61_12]HAD04109.1 two-component system response regulator [Desulfuromonas sp.]HBT83270.1 two-component system response regulator [Desulfuromonas sp.]
MPKIVLVDDCKLTLTIARDILEGAGYEVQTAESGIEANRHVFATPRPALVMMDIEMPLLSGDRVVRFFRERESTRDLPILLMSNKSSDELARLVRESGADGYIKKPLHPESLLKAIRQLLV